MTHEHKKGDSFLRKTQSVENNTRVSTGIELLDDITHGGFLPGKTHLITGMPGTGKSILSLQFLMASLAENRNSTYICVNERPDDLVATANSLGWNIEPAITEGKLQFLDMSPFFSRFAVKGTNKQQPLQNEVNIRKIMVELVKYARENSTECLVIDSINTLLPGSLEPTASSAARELVLSLEEHLGCTCLLTFDLWEASEQGRVHPIESYTASVIELGLAKEAARYDRTLVLKKMRATAVDPASYKVIIDPVKGISPTRMGRTASDIADDERQVARKTENVTAHRSEIFVRR